MFSISRSNLLPGLLLFCAISSLSASDVWDAPPFSLTAATVQRAAAEVKPAKDTNVTVLLSERRFEFDPEGKEIRVQYTIYRIENEEGVEGWAESRDEWAPWHQAKPEIKARVISPDGSVHELDTRTLNDVPVHKNSPDVYTDRRAYGGPLPAIAVGAIVEEQIITRDTAPFFKGGIVERQALVKSAPVHKSRLVISHPESVPLHYVLQQLPSATVKKSSANGHETIIIENGPLPPYTERLPFLPGDAVPYPGVEFSTGTSWQRVAEEYAHLTNDKIRLADVQPGVGKLTAKDVKPTELIRRLVAALHKNVRYTGVEFGESSLIPQFPAETLKRKYGDCKDKSALLVTMLRAAGIPANLALLDTGPGPDINNGLPGMGMFDHAIVYVPASASDGELWIDATDDYARVGDMPLMDYGRWALIIDEHTKELKKIPELGAAQNFHREFREFALTEFGPAKITERNEQTGPRESEYRQSYARDTKQVRENSEKYVKRAYLADSLVSVEHSDVWDLEKPFSVTFVAKGKRGSTDYERATMAIRIEDLLDGLPQYFTSTDADDSHQEDGDERAERPQPRTLDWQLEPFVNEWDYKITAPPGFKLRALPASKEIQLGTARLTQEYAANAEGTVVEAKLRFESGKARISVAEAKALREAAVKAKDSDPIFISFDQLGHSLMAAGKVKEGLTAYRELVQLHPKEALHRIQLAMALLQAGLGDRARVVAREAIALEPDSAQAYNTLAWVLQHDLLGRRFKPGFDHVGAIAAYRKAKQLDPKDKDVRANLGIVLEYDSAGNRYSAEAHLKEAVAEFQELKKTDEAAGRAYDDNVLYDLWYTRDFKALAEAVNTLPATTLRRTFVIAAVAAQQGAESALKKSYEVTTQEEERSKILNDAGWFLLRVRRYPEAAELLAAGARGQANENQIARFAANLKRSRVREEIEFEAGAPQGIIQQEYAMIFSDAPQYDQVRQFMSRNALRFPEKKTDRESFAKAMFQVRKQLAPNGVPMLVIGDIALANTRYSIEGSDSLGYKVTVETSGAEPQDAFVVHEDGKYKILEFGLTGQKTPENLGWQALECLTRKDVAGARHWLDWARERVHISGSDDPLAVQPFPYFWTKGQEGDAEAIRIAALVLAPSKELRNDDITALLQARESLKTDLEKTRIDLVVASAYFAQERWAELAATSQKLLKQYPDSMVAFRFLTRAYAGTSRLHDWEQLIHERLVRHPGDADYTRSAAELAAYSSDYGKARDLIKTLIDHSKATQGDLNSYAWDALFLPGPIDQESIEAAEQANQLSKNANFNIMHTLACVYARAGKPSQARDLLLKAMDAGALEQPDSAVWLALGEIAEHYGEGDAARSMYARVEKGPIEYPASNYFLAQQRLLALKSPPSSAAQAGAHSGRE